MSTAIGVISAALYVAAGLVALVDPPSLGRWRLAWALLVASATVLLGGYLMGVWR
jgi:hypothetical protein